MKLELNSLQTVALRTYNALITLISFLTSNPDVQQVMNETLDGLKQKARNEQDTFVSASSHWIGLVVRFVYEGQVEAGVVTGINSIGKEVYVTVDCPMELTVAVSQCSVLQYQNCWTAYQWDTKLEIGMGVMNFFGDVDFITDIEFNGSYYLVTTDSFTVVTIDKLWICTPK